MPELRTGKLSRKTTERGTESSDLVASVLGWITPPNNEHAIGSQRPAQKKKKKKKTMNIDIENIDTFEKRNKVYTT